MHLDQLTHKFSPRKAPDGAFSRCARWLCIALVSALVFGAPSGALAQPPASGPAPERMLLVVVPTSADLNTSKVDRFVELLKVARERRRVQPQDLPILRMSPGEPTHRQVLQRLELRADPELRTFTCERDGRGWPIKVLRAYSADTPADVVVADALHTASLASVVAEHTVGLLLVGGADDRPKTDAFLAELGRFWIARYGRVRPAPYPLASYDLDNPEVASSLLTSFPQLTQSPPLVALCRYVEGQPSEVIEVYRALDTPASLVRELSGARTLALSRLPSAQVAALVAPQVSSLGLSDDQERALLVTRLQETARQLWSLSELDDSRANQPAKRLLLKLIEESRRYLEHEEGAWLLLQESLRDYAVEPLRSDDPKLEEARTRLLHLGSSLLGDP